MLVRGVRTIRIMARTVHGGRTEMLSRRARFRGSALERLEMRGLLSHAAPIRSSPIDHPDYDGTAAEVVSSAAIRQEAPSSLPGPVGISLNGSGRAPRSGTGN